VVDESNADFLTDTGGVKVSSGPGTGLVRSEASPGGVSLLDEWRPATRDAAPSSTLSSFEEDATTRSIEIAARIIVLAVSEVTETSVAGGRFTPEGMAPDGVRQSARRDFSSRPSSDEAVLPRVNGRHLGSPYTLDARGLGHVRFIQYIFRRSRHLRTDCWGRRGGLAGLAIFRPVRRPRCDHGMSLASPADFEKQKAHANLYFDWMRQYSLLLKRFQSGLAPMMLDIFCCAGAVSDGARRAGVSSVGMDHHAQPSYVARFGEEAFVMSDATDVERLRDLVRRLRPFFIWASPPCQGYSVATNVGNASSSPRLIGVVRDVLVMLGVPFAIENVAGARAHLQNPLPLWGQLFGETCERERWIETGNGLSLQVPQALIEHGTWLRSHSCLGSRRRFPRSDLFGRSIKPNGPRVCCSGNVWTTQGSRPLCGTVVDHAFAMGIDASHMTYSELSQAVPPSYARFVVSEAIAHRLATHYGLPVVNFDEYLADPQRAKRLMQHWRRGAGATSATIGLGFVGKEGGIARTLGPPPSPHPDVVASTDRAQMPLAANTAAGDFSSGGLTFGETCEPPGGSTTTTAADTVAAADAAKHATVDAGSRVLFVNDDRSWSLSEDAFRELDYSHAGGYDRVAIDVAAPNWVSKLRPCQRHDARLLLRSSSPLQGGSNLFIHAPGASRHDLSRLARRCTGEALARRSSGEPALRVTVLVTAAQASVLSQAGFRQVMSWSQDEMVLRGADQRPGRLGEHVVAMSLGRRECPTGGVHLDHTAVESFLDPRDRGAAGCGPGAKSALAWSALERHPELWRVAPGFPDDVRRMMTEGVEIEVDDQGSAHEEPQYPFADAEHFVRGSQECDRAILCGHLEPVPADEIEASLQHGCVHPWTVVHQSEDKWRSCQDYKQGTNQRVISRPFTLCTASDVAAVVKPGSHFAKFDLRDGFWSVPVAKASRSHLMVRHPATGRLLRCTSLPFGYARSPEHFCRVTEAVAARFRQIVASMGIHIFCFVDDFCIVGDTREATELGMRLFGRLLDSLGLPYAPHKTRGPSRVIEFLGFLLCNTADYQCMGLTASRQSKLESRIDEWAAKEPSPGASRLRSDPVELARLLGHLVFASEVIPGGRVYMQAMLRQFKGLEVDWARGLVRHVSSAWAQIEVHDGFWRDLHWWRSALQRQNCRPFGEPALGEIAVVGTDASDFACGELLWIDGAREETRLIFLNAEKRRPINFRELRGTLRALELWGWRLRGRLVLIETDNTSGHEAVRKLRCKAEDMQELVRRIHALSLEHGFTLRSVHTPGLMLVRPDQTSRGSMPEEPRLRLERDTFSAIEARFGPFTEFLGAERELATRECLGELSIAPRLWAHPSFDTVGSALRLICSRMTTKLSTCPRGVVVVPLAPEAGWWKLLRHFTVVGQWRRGALSLDANVDGQWLSSLSQRPALLLAFPRTGSCLVPLKSAVQLGTPQARRELSQSAHFAPMSRTWVNTASPLPVGTLLYSARRCTPDEVVAGGTQGVSGTLYLTHELYSGEGDLLCLELRRYHSGHRHHFNLDGGSWDRRSSPPRAWSVDPQTLWVVNHLGGRLLSQQAAQRGRGPQERFIFDFDRAEDEIDRVRVQLAHAELSEPVDVEELDGLETTSLEIVGCSDEEDDEQTVRLGGEVQATSEPEAHEGPARSGGPRTRQASAADGVLASELTEATTPVRVSAAATMDDDALRPMSGYGAQHTPQVGQRPNRIARRAPDSSEVDLTEMAETRRLISPLLRSAESVRTRPSPLPAAGITIPVRCRYAAQRCAGCSSELGFDTWIIPGGIGMVHNTMRCYQAASLRRDEESASLYSSERARLRAEEGPGMICLPCPGPAPVVDLEALRVTIDDREPRLDEMAEKPSAPDRSQRVAQLEENLSESRRTMVRTCIAGQCQHAGSSEPKMTCVGHCQRSLHGVACAQLSAGHAMLAVFECSDCILSKLMDAPYPEAAVKNAEETMLLKLSHGAEKSGAGFADFVKLEAEWALQIGGGASVKLPSDSADALCMFLTWLVREKERARSLGSLWRVIGSYQMRTFRQNLTALPEVKAHYSSLLDQHGIEEHPRTSATPRMLRLALHGGIIAKHCPRPFICARTELDIAMEAGFGVRVGEAMGAGDYHGMKAGHLSILRDLSSGLITVEGMLEHSKTKFKRWVTCLGTTVGFAQMPFADITRKYWREAGMKEITYSSGGFQVTTVDYMVVRVSMLGMTQQQLDLLGGVLAASQIASIRKAAKATFDRAEKRYKAKWSKDKKYINVHGHAHDDPSMATCAMELAQAGLSSFVSIVHGPLLRSTDGYSLSHMPVDPSTTYGTLHKIMDECCELANPEGDPDPWLDLQGLDEPLWGHHSWRRMADTLARANMAKSGATEKDIDLVFGWLERMYSRIMQDHYETKFIRVKRYRVTMYT